MRSPTRVAHDAEAQAHKDDAAPKASTGDAGTKPPPIWWEQVKNIGYLTPGDKLRLGKNPQSMTTMMTHKQVVWPI